MAKERFTPPVLEKSNPRGPSALVFPERSDPCSNKPERYQRYFPGVELAANQPVSQAPVSDPPEQQEHSPPQEDAQDADPSHSELMAAFEKAAHEGFQAGLEQAQEQTQARIDEHMAHMESMLRCIIELRTSTFETYQEQCLELALTGAEALARKSFQQDKSAIRSLLTDAIQELSGQDTVLLHVGPESASELQEWVAQRFADQKIQVIVDEHMSPEDFRATTKTGSVTGNFEERLQRLRQMILQHKGTLDQADHQVPA